MKKAFHTEIINKTRINKMYVCIELKIVSDLEAETGLNIEKISGTVPEGCRKKDIKKRISIDNRNDKHGTNVQITN
jgi:hypothetical protein